LNLKSKYELNTENKSSGGFESERLMKQIIIFEDHSHDNFEEMDAQLENIEGTWDS
jgi:hypothetical protein